MSTSSSSLPVSQGPVVSIASPNDAQSFAGNREPEALLHKVKQLTFSSVQVLRGIAACFVVLHHATLYWARITHPAATGDPVGFWVNGNTGVDIFFVISGFVMTISTSGRNLGPHPARTFLKRRVLRVVPMYWIFTALFLATQLMFQQHPHWLTHGEHFAPVTLSAVVESVLFLPMFGIPIVGVGWTLTYEMYFYLLFALALAMRVKPVWLLAPLMFALVFLGHHFFPQSCPLLVEAAFSVATSELLLEFLAGVLIGMLVLIPARCNPIPAAAIGICGVTLLLLHPNRFAHVPAWNHHRWLQGGIPAAMLVLSAVLLEDRLARFWPRFLLKLGDASYSLYLCHILCLCVVMKALEAYGLLRLGVARRSDEWLSAAVCLLVAMGVAFFVYAKVELPIQIHLLHRSKPKVRLRVGLS